MSIKHHKSKNNLTRRSNTQINICTRIGTSINMYISMGVNIANKTTTISNRRVIHMHTRISVAIHASISISLLLKLIPIFASLVVLL